LTSVLRMAQKKKTTKKTTTKKKPATKKAKAPKSEAKTEEVKPVIVSSAGPTVAPKVWDKPLVIAPQKKKSWLKRLFSWF